MPTVYLVLAILLTLIAIASFVCLNLVHYWNYRWKYYPVSEDTFIVMAFLSQFLAVFTPPFVWLFWNLYSQSI